MVPHMTPKTSNKRKNNNYDFLKAKHFCASKDTIKKVKRQNTKWEKIFTDCISDKEFVFRCIKKFSNPTKNNINFKISKMIYASGKAKLIIHLLILLM